ncbi:acylphosphatase [Cognatilysobacter terrigena]|uniref:acylphosphatase n=1 Tax=Cognatilysobacter terrigena TaxID=2488749 RepID=UPI00105CDA33|nr:acylphosphatase [Lysobacter terrigena]
MSAARFLVEGRVQGVAFRAHARHEAENLGLTGHARNLPDGRVEVVAHGDVAAIEALAEWLALGPPHARVDAVHREALDATSAPRGFSIG